MRNRWLVAVVFAAIRVSGLASDNRSNHPYAVLFDRFRASVNPGQSTLRLFDRNIVFDQDATWVAVYRSSNNKPSVLVKDEFLQAMRSATDQQNQALETKNNNHDDASTVFDKSSTAEVQQQQAPVAVARLRPSSDFEGSYILDSMRCVLKKENTDSTCDGGSEHTEALATAIDTLLLHHLHSSSSKRFEGAIRTKATLVSGV